MNVAGIEYFIDADPGFGNGTPVEIISRNSNLIADFVVDLGGLSDGDHVVYMRTRDQQGHWGSSYAHAFSMKSKIMDNKEVVSWFRMYPNPDQGTVSLIFSESRQERLNLMINDMDGRMVSSTTLSSMNTPVTVRLPAGVYRLTIIAGNNSFKQMLVIH
ncbi:MAG: T9SS type A sorting domain-containing protein [Bacteroidales bacterium]|nr:T9SS type A sorting domain-containing protein [Bacteroidales bacterium]